MSHEMQPQSPLGRCPHGQARAGVGLGKMPAPPSPCPAFPTQQDIGDQLAQHRLMGAGKAEGKEEDLSGV